MTTRASLYSRLPLLDTDRWWLELAAEAPGDRVLELGAGVGRLTTALAAAGHRVTAVERDPGMARVLRGRVGASVEVVEADAATLVDHGDVDGGGYGLVMLPTSLLNELPDAAAREAVLRLAAGRCRPGGRVAIHVLGPWWLAALPEQVRGELVPADGSPRIDVRIDAEPLDAFAGRRRAVSSYRFPDGEVLRERLDAAIVTPGELTTELTSARLTLTARYGAVPPAPMAPHDPAWHLVARPS